MHQSCQNLIVLILASISAFIVTPCHAQNQGETNNSNTQKISPGSSELTTGVDTTLETLPSQSSDLNSSTNNKAEKLSENSSNSSTTAALTTTDPISNPRVPISSRIFAVPSMQQ
ncbi:hypothetical protein [Calothrix sp. NIES-2098]|uniref:hypothetical protein n=1 Tax=Calothrix sp. NIES-2098 TaxID=1954171 RepID=UPI000B62333A|nr:hypothetical protein NIES2098_27260 [Calothrix sp. NIES-2098]